MIRKIFVVYQDDDQSIYSWKKIEIKNFLTFDKIYKNGIKLEQKL